MKNKLFILLLLLSSTAHAFVEPVDYKGIMVKIYHEDTNMTKIFSLLDKVPDEYIEGLRYIKFHSKTYCSYWICIGGYYWRGERGIEMFQWTVMNLAHEFAHYRQETSGDDLQNLHGGRFYEYYDEIYFAMSNYTHKPGNFFSDVTFIRG